MLYRLVGGRSLTFGGSCLLHLALIGILLLAEQWSLFAHASKPPALPVELVALDEPPRRAPPPPPAKMEPSRVVSPRPLPSPKPVHLPTPHVPTPTEEPKPQAVEAVSAPPTAELPHEAPEPPTLPAPASGASSTLSAAPVGDPVPMRPAPPLLASTSAAPTSAAPTPAAPAPVQSASVSSAPEPRSVDAIGLGNPPGSPAQTVASAPSRESGATGAITQHARPQGGYQVRPSYPLTARRKSIQGTTLLKVHVLIDGRVGDVVVQESAGHPDLDQAAADAVRRWRFEPARAGVEPVAMWVLLPFEFRLK
jgi:protein TonB